MLTGIVNGNQLTVTPAKIYMCELAHIARMQFIASTKRRVVSKSVGGLLNDELPPIMVVIGGNNQRLGEGPAARLEFRSQIAKANHFANTTRVPTRTRPYRSMMSLLCMRMQPADTRPPIKAHM